MSRQPGFPDPDGRYALLGKSGDPLERPALAVKFGAFRFRLEKALKRSPLSGLSAIALRQMTLQQRAHRHGGHLCIVQRLVKKRLNSSLERPRQFS